MNVERLKQLKALLTDLEGHRADLSLPYGEVMQFDMERWVGPVERGKQCGTSACAGGWAALYLPFQVQGLRWEDNKSMGYNIRYHDYIAISALSVFFGLNSNAAYYIFVPSRYWSPDRVSRHAVIEHIDHVLKGKFARS